MSGIYSIAFMPRDYGARPVELKALIRDRVFPFVLPNEAARKRGAEIIAVTPWGIYVVVGPHLVPIERPVGAPAPTVVIGWNPVDGPKKWSPPSDWDEEADIPVS